MLPGTCHIFCQCWNLTMKTFIWIVLQEIPTCELATWQRAARSSSDSPFGGGHPRPWCQGQHICYEGIISIFLLDHPVIKYHDPHLCRRRTSGFDGDRVREVALRSARVEALVTSSVFLGEWDIWVGGGHPHLKMVGVYLYCPHGAWNSRYGEVTFGSARFWSWYYWLSTRLQWK